VRVEAFQRYREIPEPGGAFGRYAVTGKPRARPDGCFDKHLSRCLICYRWGLPHILLIIIDLLKIPSDNDLLSFGNGDLQDPRMLL
jgi:hypothetical protein